MSPRPPTLREKRRYLLAQVEPCGVPVDGKGLYYAIHDAATSLWGDLVVAAMQPAVIGIENGYAILRCRRGTEREYATCLSTVTRCGDCRIALRVIATSGTIDSLRDRIKERGSYLPNEGAMISAEIGGKSDQQSPVTGGPDGQRPAGTGDSPEIISPGARDCTFENREVQIVHCDGHKVDVIEKGFKNTHRLFLTTADLEEK